MIFGLSEFVNIEEHIFAKKNQNLYETCFYVFYHIL